jgi:hypothetical protein
MNPSRVLRLAPWLISCAAMLSAGGPQAGAAEGDEGITAVSSRVSVDYVRARLADGSFQTEEYAFGNGGHYAGPFPDPTIDNLSFLDVARVIAAPLAAQNYLPAKDPGKTKLLIMLYWGTTTTPTNPSSSNGYLLYGSASSATASSSGAPKMGASAGSSGAAGNSELDEALALMDFDNRIRDHLNYTNAAMLGYDSEDMISTERGEALRHSALRHLQKDLVLEIEQNRYFVVLMAYDFQILRTQKKHKLLWDARFSIAQRSNDFGKTLPAMARYASIYFGQASNGLVHKPIPIGKVEVGEPTVIETLGSPKN